MNSRTEIFFLFFLLLVFYAKHIQADELLLADYLASDSQAEPGTFRTVGTGTVSIGTSPPDFTGGSSLKLQNYDANSAWGILHIKDFDTVLNISAYQSLEFSFYSEGDDADRTVSVQLRFTPGETPYPFESYVPVSLRGKPPEENVWEMVSKPLLSSGFGKWETVGIPLSLSEFARATTYNASNRFDLTKLAGIGVLILNGEGDPATEEPVYVDDVKVVTNSVSLSVSPTSVDFGELAPSISKYRFESAILTVDYLASANDPWEIRIYTSNPGDVLGLVNGSHNILLKVDPGADDDVDNDVHWNGNGDNGTPDNASDDVEPSFFFVLDNDTKDESGDPFYTKIASSANENPFSGSVDFNFGLDASGAAIGDYSSDVTIELFIDN